MCMIALPLTPTEGLSWRGNYNYHQSRPNYHHQKYRHNYHHDRYRPNYHYQKYRHYNRYYHDDAWAWGIAGLVVGSALTAIVTRPVVYEPSRPAVVYVESSPPRTTYQSPVGQARIYTYPPEVPPGMCRWERPMVDEYGRSVLNRDGMPGKVYTLGSCEFPPPY